MAEDARISTAFPSHHKTQKVRRRLGIEGCWHLMCLFLWAANSESYWHGDLSGMSDEDIEINCGWQGEVGSLVKVLKEVGYLDGEENHRVIHDWADHNPYAAGRGRRIERSRKANDRKYNRHPKDDIKESLDAPTVKTKDRPATPATPATPLPPKSALPDWIPTVEWEGFVQMRKRIKVPLTDRAIDLAVKTLSDLRDQGNEPARVLDQSTMNGWKGLFALNGNGKHQPSSDFQPAKKARAELYQDQ